MTRKKITQKETSENKSTSDSCLVSVIIPTYNRVKWISSAIESVFQQTIKNLELIVVDDGSKDDTGKIVKYLDSKVRYIRQEHQGVSAARNTGIRASKGQYIGFLDSDDLWKPKKLELQLQLFQRKPYLLLVHSNEVWIRGDKKVNPRKIHEKSGGWIFSRCLKLCCISPSSVIVHSDLFKYIGLFDEKLPACEDYDLWLRTTCLFPVGYVPEKLVIKHGGHPGQLSKEIWGLDRFRVYSIMKLLDRNQLSFSQRVEAINMLKEKCGILIKGFKKRGNHKDAKRFEKLGSRFE